ncbi:hypothetical protein C2W59_02375 [Bacillus pumilus]|nr:hypothetical protein C2W59_02375 [Bacillus pumilus]
MLTLILYGGKLIYVADDEETKKHDNKKVVDINNLNVV